MTQHDDGSMYLPRPERYNGMSQSQRDLYSLLGALLIAFGLLRRGAAWFAIPAGIYTAIKGMTGRSLLESSGSAGANEARGRDRDQVSVPHETGVHLSHSVTIHRDPTDIYAALKNPETLEQIVPQLDSVTLADPDHGRWTIRLPGGIPVTSEIELVNEEHGEVIGWRSVNSPIGHAGSIRFTPSSRGGTRVRVEAEYQPPAGMIGVGAAKILGLDPDTLVTNALQNLKQLMEKDAVGDGSGVSKARPARPERPTTGVNEEESVDVE